MPRRPLRRWTLLCAALTILSLALAPARARVELRSDRADDAAHARGVQRIRAVEQQLHLRSAAQRIAAQLGRDHDEGERRPAQQQRLAFARIFLHQPDIIVLDEATAALDPESQDSLMALLSDEPEHLTLVSVGHRPELEAFHSRKVVLERRRGKAKLVSDIYLEQTPNRKRWLKRLIRRSKRAA